MVSGKIFDSYTKEALVGANVMVPETVFGAVTDIHGYFSLTVPAAATQLQVTYVGYDRKLVDVTEGRLSIALSPSINNLEQVIVTASREASLRVESPIAISKLSAATIQETKAVVLAEIINKVPGVVMLNYNNEQHGMAIRQPMGTSAYFLYLEDGLPLRPMGIFNHNALIEMNALGLSSIEVVKGPASSLYGPEAVGGALNFITHKPTAVPTARVGVQGDQWGYKRIQYAAGGMVTKKLGLFISGFEARQRGAWQTYSDYDKSSINARLDYQLTKKTNIVFAFSGHEYYSDAAGSVDSIAFYNRDYTSTTDFTYRKVHSQRTRLTVSHQWSANQETTVTLGYRDNYIEQNPNYAIRWTQGSTSASGEVNQNSFYSRVGTLQHSVRFPFLDGRLLIGASMDYSPTRYWAYLTDLSAQLRPDGKSVEKYTMIDQHPGSFISNYTADLKNYAAYSQFEVTPLERLKLTVGLRYDDMSFDYDNFIGNTSGRKTFRQFTPKIGATYDLQNDKGIYANFSQGFSPPGLTAIFRRRPGTDPNAPAEFYYNLEPARFDNIEIGAWSSFWQNRLYADVAIYHMIGRKELLNIRQADNSTDYQSAGKTLHRGIEYSLAYKPSPEWSIRFGGTNSIHRFEEFTLSNRSSDDIRNVNGNDMPQAPRWIANAEVTYKPTVVKGLRVSTEWQRIGKWYQDQVNNVMYADKGFLGLKGISYLNVRTGYNWKSVEVFMNVLNLTNELYANSATRGNSASDRTTFTPAAPRTFILGVQYNLNGNKSR
jgi:iron complex outermembrane recepter protein